MSLRNASENRRSGPLSLGGLVVALGSAAALPCHAAGRCALEVTGPDTPAWRDAVGALDLRAAEDSDCAAIRLSLGAVARLTFETNDGRRAERELRDPTELAPTLDALLVTGVPLPPEPEPEPRLGPLRPPEHDDHVRTHATGADMLTAAFALQLGLRGGAGGLMSPVVSGHVVMDRSHWEIGVWGALEPEYTAFGPTPIGVTEPGDVMMVPSDTRPLPPPPERASAGVVGIMVGRQVPFTHLDVIFGGRVGVAALRHFDGSNDGAELRVGGGADVVFPRASTLHFRTGIGAEVVPNDLQRSGASAVPWWALSARLGFEVGGS